MRSVSVTLVLNNEWPPDRTAFCIRSGRGELEDSVRLTLPFSSLPGSDWTWPDRNAARREARRAPSPILYRKKILLTCRCRTNENTSIILPISRLKIAKQYTLFHYFFQRKWRQGTFRCLGMLVAQAWGPARPGPTRWIHTEVVPSAWRAPGRAMALRPNGVPSVPSRVRPLGAAPHRHGSRTAARQRINTIVIRLNLISFLPGTRDLYPYLCVCHTFD